MVRGSEEEGLDQRKSDPFPGEGDRAREENDRDREEEERGRCLEEKGRDPGEEGLGREIVSGKGKRRERGGEEKKKEDGKKPIDEWRKGIEKESAWKEKGKTGGSETENEMKGETENSGREKGNVRMKWQEN